MEVGGFVGGLVVSVVTAPLLWVLRTEGRAIRKQIRAILNEHGVRIMRLDERKFR